MHGIIPAASEGLELKAPHVYPDDDAEWAHSVHLWNAQQVFDHRLHVERGMPLPRDDPTNADLMRTWICGLAFAFLEELDELREAFEQDNADEETVDTLHFVLSLAEKVGMTPHDLGRFEDRFDAAAAAADAQGYTDWKSAYHGELQAYVEAIAALKGSHHKWWKNQPGTVDMKPVWDALRRIDHLNLVIASRVFADADAMYARYMGKVEENHQRQDGTIESRADYAVKDA